MNDNPRTKITLEQRAFAENALHNLSFAKLIGMRLVELEPDLATISIEMRDTAMAFAVRTRLAINEATATIDLTIHYVRPHLEGTFICTARVVRAGKRIFTVSADVHNDEGKLIATGLSTYTRV
jgi:acyl-coenzyme A thioesterase PaaI-like protein